MKKKMEVEKEGTIALLVSQSRQRGMGNGASPFVRKQNWMRKPSANRRNKCENTTPKKCLGGVATERENFSVWLDHKKELKSPLVV